MLTIMRSELKRVWNGLKRVVGTRSPIPVLNHLRWQGAGGGCTVTATDLEQCLIATVPAEAAGDCRFLLPAEELKALASGRGEGVVRLVPLAATSLSIINTIQGQEIGRTIATLDVAEWPATGGAIPTQPAAVEVLVRACRKVLVAAAHDASRIALHGVYLDQANGVAVATDGRRLLQVGLAGVDIPGSVILPLSRVLDSDLLAGPGALGLATEDGRGAPTLRLCANGWDYRVRTVEARYPDYRQVVPDVTGFPTTIRMAEADLPVLRAACSQFPDDPEHAVALYADAAQVALAHVGGTGSGPEIVHVVLPQATARTAAPVAVFVNRQFLLDGLDAGLTRIHLKSPEAALRFCGQSALDTYVLMPLRGYATAPVLARFAATAPSGGLVTPVAEPTAEAAALPPPAEPATPRDEEDTAMPEEITTPEPTGIAPVVPAASLAALLAAIETAREKLAAATQALRHLKSQAREVERQHKAEQREHAGLSEVVAKLRRLAA